MSEQKPGPATRCSQRVSSDIWGGSPCQLRPVAFEDGEWWCRLHCKAGMEKRQAARDVRYKKLCAKWDEQRRVGQIEKAGPDLLAALKAAIAAGMVPDPSSLPNTQTAVGDATRMIYAAIAKAEGGAK